MSDVPRAELRHIANRLSELETAQDKLSNQVRALDDGLDDRIELAMRRFYEDTSKGSRDTTSWVISIVAFALMVLFALLDFITDLRS